MESIETLQRIKELEENSEKKVKQAEDKAAEIIKESLDKSQKKIRDTEKEAKDIINNKVEKEEKAALNERETEIAEAKKKAEKIKPLEKDEMLEIFNEILKEAFDL